MKMFQKLLMLGTLLGVSISTNVEGAACAMSGPWSTYQATGACTIGNITISNWSLVSTANPSGSAIPASSVTLTLDNSVAGLLGMQWNMGMSATGLGNFKDMYFTYILSSPDGFIGDILNFNGSAVNGATAGVSSTVCTTGPIGTCAPANRYQTDVVNPPPILASSMTFPSSTTIWAGKDMVVTGEVNGTAQISSVTNTYQYNTGVPEPMSFVLMGAGLVGIAALRRRNG